MGFRVNQTGHMASLQVFRFNSVRFLNQPAKDYTEMCTWFKSVTFSSSLHRHIQSILMHQAVDTIPKELGLNK